VIDGQRAGTLSVDSAGHADQTLQATVSGPGSHDYQLTSTGTFDAQGRKFQLHGGWQRHDPGHGVRALVLGRGRRADLAANRCPAAGGQWPLLLRPH